MKFTLLTQAVMAIPMLTGAMAAPTENAEVKRAACSFEVKYVKSWVKSGLDRYRMQLITNPRDDRLLGTYCDLYKKTIGFTSNNQCFWGDAYYLDSSVVRGPAGHQAILEAHNKACDDFQVITGCQTIRHF